MGGAGNQQKSKQKDTKGRQGHIETFNKMGAGRGGDCLDRGRESPQEERQDAIATTKTRRRGKTLTCKKRKKRKGGHRGKTPRRIPKSKDPKNPKEGGKLSLNKGGGGGGGESLSSRQNLNLNRGKKNGVAQRTSRDRTRDQLKSLESKKGKQWPVWKKRFH